VPPDAAVEVEPPGAPPEVAGAALDVPPDAAVDAKAEALGAQPEVAGEVPVVLPEAAVGVEPPGARQAPDVRLKAAQRVLYLESALRTAVSAPGEAVGPSVKVDQGGKSARRLALAEGVVRAVPAAFVRTAAQWIQDLVSVVRVASSSAPGEAVGPGVKVDQIEESARRLALVEVVRAVPAAVVRTGAQLQDLASAVRVALLSAPGGAVGPGAKVDQTGESAWLLALAEGVARVGPAAVVRTAPLRIQDLASVVRVALLSAPGEAVGPGVKVDQIEESARLLALVEGVVRAVLAALVRAAQWIQDLASVVRAALPSAPGEAVGQAVVSRWLAGRELSETDSES
jgi:hypothetical protein